MHNLRKCINMIYPSEPTEMSNKNLPENSRVNTFLAHPLNPIFLLKLNSLLHKNQLYNKYLTGKRN